MAIDKDDEKPVLGGISKTRMGDLQSAARKAARSGGGLGSLGGGDESYEDQLEREIKEGCGISIRDTREYSILRTMVRRMGFNSQGLRRAPDSGSHDTIAKDFARLLHPEDEMKRTQVADAVRRIFIQITDLDDPQSFNHDYTKFLAQARAKNPKWQELRRTSHERMHAFAAELTAMQDIVRQAVDAGQLPGNNQLAVSITSWKRDTDELVAGLRNMGKLPALAPLDPPATTTIGTMMTGVQPFAERAKPQPVAAATKVLKVLEEPKGPDLSGLELILKDEDIKNKDAVITFVKRLGSDDLLNSGEQNQRNKELRERLNKVKEQAQQVSEGKATGGLTAALDVLVTYMKAFGKTLRKRARFDEDEALPTDTGVSCIDAIIKLEAIYELLDGERKKLTTAIGTVDKK